MIPLASTGCLVCGAPLRYDTQPIERACHYCQRPLLTEASCEQGHFVCDTCHAQDGVAAVEAVCLNTHETDLLALLEQLHHHPAIPMHGPEHHGMVPGIILAAYRNSGGDVPDQLLQSVIQRGMKVPGGFCGFAGTCGAAVGVGIAFAALVGSTPVKPEARQRALGVTGEVLGALASRPAARCCQRDAWIALKTAAALSRELLPIPLRAEGTWRCRQHHLNKQCLGPSCPVRGEG